MRRGKAKRKACTKCKAIVPYNVNKCPICGNTEFSEDFLGMLAIIDLNSEIAKKLNIKKEWIYAIKVR